MKLSAYMPRLSAALAILALALGATACGDSDDDGDSGASASTPSASTTDETTNGDNGDGESPDASSGSEAEETKVAAVVRSMYRSFGNGDAAGVCSVMSDNAQQQIAQSAPIEDPGKRTCAASLSNFLGAAKRSGALRHTANAKVGKVEVDGDQANVTITLAGRSGDVRLIKEGDEWHFDAAPLGGQTSQ